MKIFLIGFLKEMDLKIAEKIRNENIEIIYWTGRNKYFEKASKDKNYKNTIFHDTCDIMRAVPAPKMYFKSYKPIDKNIIEKFLKCESEIWMMFDRYEDRKDLSLRQMKHLYYEILEYWYNVLREIKPDALVFATDVPHTVFNYIIYSVAKEFKIKTVMAKRAKGIKPERVLFFEDFKSYEMLKEKYYELQDRNFSYNELSAEMKDFYNKQIDPSFDSTPFYQTKDYIKNKIQRSEYFLFSAVLKNVLQGSFTKTFFSYIKMIKSKKRIFGAGEKKTRSYYEKLREQKSNKKSIESYKKSYKKYETKADNNERFIYIPLHYQPEASTTPLGDVYDDQILMINMISKSLPDGWKIYVKENIIQWKWPKAYLGRYYNYYEQLARMKNVKLISPDVSTFDLIEKSQAVAVVSGTAGFEAVLRSKPSLLFGYTWFMDCEGIFHVQDFDKCREVLTEIKNGYVLDKKKLFCFLGAIDKVGVRGYVHERFSKAAEIDYNKNIENVSKNIIKILKK